DGEFARGHFFFDLGMGCQRPAGRRRLICRQDAGSTFDTARLGGRQFDERFDGSARAFGGAGFDDFTHEHEKRNHAGDLVIAGSDAASTAMATSSLMLSRPTRKSLMAVTTMG